MLLCGVAPDVLHVIWTCCTESLALLLAGCKHSALIGQSMTVLQCLLHQRLHGTQNLTGPLQDSWNEAAQALDTANEGVACASESG